jgi:hypothetical protein
MYGAIAGDVELDHVHRQVAPPIAQAARGWRIAGLDIAHRGVNMVTRGGERLHDQPAEAARTTGDQDVHSSILSGEEH